VVRKLGPRANPAALKEVPWRAVAVWLFYAGAGRAAHRGCVLCVNLWLSECTSIFAAGACARRVHRARHGVARGAGQVPPPGSLAPRRAPPARPCDGTRPRRRPALETPPDILLETLYQSLAFFYVNPIMSSLGLSFIPDVPARPARPRVIAARGRQLRRPRAQVHPVGLGVFNFVNAWCAPGAVLGASPMAWAPRAEACGGAQVADAAAADDGRPQGPGRAAEVPALRGHAGTAQSAAAALLRMRAPAADAPRARSS